MKKFYFIISLLYLAKFTNVLFPQQYGWMEQTITPAPPALTCVSTWASVYMYPGMCGWIGGINGTILFTTNGGTNWFYRTSSLVGTNTINTIEAINSNTALLSFRNGTTSYILRTTDSGLNWSVVYQQTNGYIRSIKMQWRNGWQSSFPCFVIGDPVGGRWTILKTTDGGASFDSTGMYISQSGNESSFNNSLDIIPYSYYPPLIMFGTNNSKIYRTTNQGINWSMSIIPFQNILTLTTVGYNPQYAGGISTVKSTDFGST